MPFHFEKEAKAIVQDLRDQLSEGSRSCLAAIFTYQICLVRHLFSIISVIIAKAQRDQKIDAVMTVATKGFPLANAVANVLNVPLSLSVAI